MSDFNQNKAEREQERKTGTRWFSWLFGVALVATLVWVVVERSEHEELARLLIEATPVRLLLGALLQIGTYLAEARILQLALRRAHISKPLSSYVALGFAKLFLDHTVPTAGLTGTVLLVRALDCRGVDRGASMAAVVVGLVSHYAAHALAVMLALGIVWIRGDLSRAFVGLAAAFALLTAAIPTLLLRVSRGSNSLPRWARRLPLARSWLDAIAEATPEIAHDALLTARCTALQLAVIRFDAATLWAMLWALGLWVDPAPVFASFMLSTLVRILGIVPGGLGIFEATSVGTLRLMGVSVAAALAGTLLFRGFSFWLPLLPGTFFARQEARAP